MKNKSKPLKETFALAFQNYKNKDFKSSELLCKKILSIDSNHFDSIFLLATLSAIQRNFSEAKKLLCKANYFSIHIRLSININRVLVPGKPLYPLFYNLALIQIVQMNIYLEQLLSLYQLNT